MQPKEALDPTIVDQKWTDTELFVDTVSWYSQLKFLGNKAITAREPSLLVYSNNCKVHVQNCCNGLLNNNVIGIWLVIEFVLFIIELVWVIIQLIWLVNKLPYIIFINGSTSSRRARIPSLLLTLFELQVVWICYIILPWQMNIKLFMAWQSLYADAQNLAQETE
jgi:hypothetical protein